MAQHLDLALEAVMNGGEIARQLIEADGPEAADLAELKTLIGFVRSALQRGDVHGLNVYLVRMETVIDRRQDRDAIENRLHVAVEQEKRRASAVLDAAGRKNAA